MTLTVHDIKHHLNLSHDFNSDNELIAYKIGAAIDFVSAYIGQPAAGFASGSITFAPATIADGETITIGNETYAITAGAPQDMAKNLVADIEANTASRPIWFPSATAEGATVYLIANDADAAANGFKLETNSPAVTLSGPTMTGGVTPLPAIAEAVRRLAAHFYENREAVMVGASVDELPLGVWDLITPFRKWGF